MAAKIQFPALSDIEEIRLMQNTSRQWITLNSYRAVNGLQDGFFLMKFPLLNCIAVGPTAFPHWRTSGSLVHGP